MAKITMTVEVDDDKAAEIFSDLFKEEPPAPPKPKRKLTLHMTSPRAVRTMTKKHTLTGIAMGGGNNVNVGLAEQPFNYVFPCLSSGKPDHKTPMDLINFINRVQPGTIDNSGNFTQPIELNVTMQNVKTGKQSARGGNGQWEWTEVEEL